MEIKVLSNKIQCTICNQIIESHTIHDFKFCDCGASAIDGGHNYPRRIGALYKDLSVYYNKDMPHKEIVNNLKWGVNYNKKGDLLKQTEWRLIKNMETSHIEKILELFPGINPFYKKTFINELKTRKEIKK